MQQALTDPVWGPALIALFGLMFGSFFNVVIYRLPRWLQQQWRQECQLYLDMPNEPAPRFNLCWPASHCPHCQTPLAWWHNLPLISFILLRGRCQHCQEAISWRYPLVELGTALLWGLIWLQLGANWLSLCLILAASMLWILFWIDAEHQLLPDILTLPLLWAGLLSTSLTAYQPLADAVWGAALGYLSLWSLYWLFKLATGKEGFGYGDFKLLAALGAWTGPWTLPWLLLAASVTGLFYAGVLRVLGKLAAGQAFAFGPALVLAGGAILLLQHLYPNLLP
ncbi:prepilin peptidase [Balneatrix alpica]|uniref:prepilin peptidase n=1 Tax=Balneatrix alpica TaxID=75684 RepID=UPI002739B9FD|nr:A24 family peptidase [Balneatrix alpica]